MDDIILQANENSYIQYGYYNKVGDFILHREDGPAVVSVDGHYSVWCRNGVCSREDGPAVIASFLSDIEEYQWYVNGFQISDDVIKWMQLNPYIPCEYRQWNKLHRMLFKLTFA